jgi:hypothetical protein
MFPLGGSSRATIPLATGSPPKTIGLARVCQLEGSGRRGPACHDDVGLQADQLLRERWYPIGVTTVPTVIR